MGIRDFIQNLQKHRELTAGVGEIPAEERDEILKEAEFMAGMAEHALKGLGSVLENRRLNLHEEHAVRFAQDIFIYLRDEEEKVKEALA